MGFQLRLLIMGLMVGLVIPAASGEDEPESNNKTQQWQEFYRGEAATYQFSLQGEEPAELKLHANAAMHWVSINDFNGSVFLWTREGRPEVVGTFFSFPRGNSGSRNVLHEFHSFSANPVQATAGDSRVSLQEGVELKPIPGAPPPAMLAAQRRLQARALARDFSAHMDRQGERWELRLLNQPIFNYSETSEEVLGGAVFALVGYITDPEILLLIEARQTDSGPQWFYAPARLSDKSLWLKHKDAEVWQFLATGQADPRYYLSPLRAATLNDAPKAPAQR